MEGRIFPPSNGYHHLSIDRQPQGYFQEAEPKYPTGFGILTFQELYASTDRIVGYTLREKLGMTNPEDVDDCMQAGYLKVWQQLQKNPLLLADKPKKYVVQAVVLRSKAQRYAHLRHQRKIVYDADASTLRNGFHPSTQQIDTWIDLQQALAHVGEQVAALDTPLFILALYTLLTDVKKQDVATLFGCGVSTLTRARKQIRCVLARELAGYGKPFDTSAALFIPKRRQPARTGAPSVATLLFEQDPR